MAAVLDLAPPEWTTTQTALALVVATLLPVFPLNPGSDDAGGTPGRHRAASHGPFRRATSRTPRRTSQPMDVDIDDDAAGRAHGHPRSLAGAFRHAGNLSTGEGFTRDGGVAAAPAGSATAVPDVTGTAPTPQHLHCHHTQEAGHPDRPVPPQEADAQESSALCLTASMPIMPRQRDGILLLTCGITSTHTT